MLECTRRRFPTRRGPRDAAPRPQGALSTRFQSTAKELGNSASYLPFDGLRQAHRYPVGHGGIAESGGAHPPLIAGLAHRYPADIGGIVGPRFRRLGRTKCLLLKKRSKQPIMLNGRGCRPTRRVHGCASPGGSEEMDCRARRGREPRVRDPSAPPALPRADVLAPGVAM